MKVTISNVLDPGKLEAERLVLTVRSDTDIGSYVVFQGTNAEGDSVESDEQKHTFWFADKQVKAGDLVVLYTKEGKESVKELKGGLKTHFFYWGLGTSMWTIGHTPVLIEIADWEFGKRFEEGKNVA